MMRVLLAVSLSLGCRHRGQSQAAASDPWSGHSTAALSGMTGAVSTPTGLRILVLSPGTGTTHPTVDSSVRVHYTAWRADGSVLDSSIERGTPAVFRLSSVIAGFAEGLTQMVEGERARLWIPAELAYKDRPGYGGPLVFDVELVEIVR